MELMHRRRAEEEPPRAVVVGAAVLERAVADVAGGHRRSERKLDRDAAVLSAAHDQRQARLGAALGVGLDDVRPRGDAADRRRPGEGAAAGVEDRDRPAGRNDCGVDDRGGAQRRRQPRIVERVRRPASSCASASRCHSSALRRRSRVTRASWARTSARSVSSSSAASSERAASASARCASSARCRVALHARSAGSPPPASNNANACARCSAPVALASRARANECSAATRSLATWWARSRRAITRAPP